LFVFATYVQLAFWKKEKPAVGKFPISMRVHI